MTDLPQIKKVATIKEIADIFQIAKHFVRQLVLTNKVNYVKAGSKYLVNIKSVANYLDGSNLKEVCND